jgi:hypothetical protein
MDPQMLRKILSQFRSEGPGVTNAPLMQAPTAAPAPGLDEAYDAPITPMQQSQPMPMQYDPQLEQQAEGMNNELEPIVQQIMQRLGMMGIIRNRSNTTMNQSLQG